MNNDTKAAETRKLAEEIALEKLEQLAQEAGEDIVNSYSEAYKKAYTENFVIGFVEGFTLVASVVRDFFQTGDLRGNCGGQQHLHRGSQKTSRQM